MISDRIDISRYTCPNEIFEYMVVPMLLQSHLKLECCKPLKAAHHLTKCDVSIDIKLFPADNV